MEAFPVATFVTCAFPSCLIKFRTMCCQNSAMGVSIGPATGPDSCTEILPFYTFFRILVFCCGISIPWSVTFDFFGTCASQTLTWLLCASQLARRPTRNNYMTPETSRSQNGNSCPATIQVQAMLMLLTVWWCWWWWWWWHWWLMIDDWWLMIDDWWLMIGDW